MGIYGFAEERAEKVVLLSFNGDFADIVTYPPQDYCGIITFQVNNRPELLPHLLHRLHQYLAAHSHSEEYRGRLFIIDVNKIRIRG